MCIRYIPPILAKYVLPGDSECVYGTEKEGKISLISCTPNTDSCCKLSKWIKEPIVKRRSSINSNCDFSEETPVHQGVK